MEGGFQRTLCSREESLGVRGFSTTQPSGGGQNLPKSIFSRFREGVFGSPNFGFILAYQAFNLSLGPFLVRRCPGGPSVHSQFAVSSFWGLMSWMFWREKTNKSLPKVLESRQLGEKSVTKGSSEGKLDTK